MRIDQSHSEGLVMEVKLNRNCKVENVVKEENLVFQIDRNERIAIRDYIVVQIL